MKPSAESGTGDQPTAEDIRQFMLMILDGIQARKEASRRLWTDFFAKHGFDFTKDHLMLPMCEMRLSYEFDYKNIHFHPAVADDEAVFLTGDQYDTLERIQQLYQRRNGTL